MLISRILQGVVFALASAATAWSLWWWHIGEKSLALAGAVLILFGHFLVLSLESLLIFHINRHDAAPPAGLRYRLRALFGEAILLPQVFYGRQAFRHKAVADMPYPASAAPQRGVVLVHGFYCNRAFWNPWLHRLKVLGIPCVAVDLSPPFDSIDNYPPLIEEAVRTLENQTGMSPVLVGHSMGGLALRAWLCTEGNEKRGHRIITIGTPHRGTWLGRFAYSENGRQMALESAWLHALRQREPSRRYAMFTCFWSHCDNVVFPASSATLPGAENIHVEGSAHIQMTCRPEVFDELLCWLDDQRRLPAQEAKP